MGDEQPDTEATSMIAPPQRREALDAAMCIIDEVLTDSSEVLYQHYLEEETSDFSVRLAMQEIVEVLGLASHA